MTDEKREEIIKSLAMDMSMEQIAALEDVPVSEVEQIKYDYADRVERKRKWLKERYGLWL